MLCVNSLLESHSYPMAQSLISDPLYRLQVGFWNGKMRSTAWETIVDHSCTQSFIFFPSSPTIVFFFFSFSCPWIVSEGTLSQALLQGVLFLSLRSITPCVHTSLWAQKLRAFRLYVSQFITYVTNNRQKWHFNLWVCCFFVSESLPLFQTFYYQYNIKIPLHEACSLLRSL